MKNTRIILFPIIGLFILCFSSKISFCADSSNYYINPTFFIDDNVNSLNFERLNGENGSSPFNHQSKTAHAKSTNEVPSDIDFDVLVESVINNWKTSNVTNNLSAFVDVLDEISCNSNETSEAIINIAGGSGNYLVMIDGNPPISEISPGIFSTTISGGTYGITITDLEDNCMLVDNFAAGQPSPINIMTEIIEIDSCAGTILDLDITVSGGTPPYESEFNMTNSGVEVIVTDSDDCEATVFVPNPPLENALVISEVSSFPTEPNEDNGSINITVEGGEPPYFYQWQDEDGNVLSDDEDIEDLAAGIYTVFISDSEGCSISSGEIEVDMTTSSFEQNETRYLIYPNPVSQDHVFLDGNHAGNLSYTLFSSSGDKLLSGILNPSSKNIDVHMLKSGMYYLSLSNDKGNAEVHKFIKH